MSSVLNNWNSFPINGNFSTLHPTDDYYTFALTKITRKQNSYFSASHQGKGQLWSPIITIKLKHLCSK